jgi:2'-5' RNA ligase
MRVFLAIALPDDVKAKLTSAVQRFAPVAIDVKWYTKDQFHLTLAYLGEVSPAILPHVTAAADRVCATLPAFPCRAFGLGFFGTKRNPQTLWAGIDPQPTLEALQESLWKELKKFGFENGEPDFSPHITLGRCRESARNHPVVEAMDADEEVSFGEWEVARVTLFESRLTPRGALYRALSHSALAGV